MIILCVFVVAYRGHVRWAKPTAYCTPTEWKKWSGHVDHVENYPSEDAFGYLELHQADEECHALAE